MGWWGKLIGGAFGFMIGGPLGALLGAALGHNFDRGLDRLTVNGESPHMRQHRIQGAFFTATFSVMGHVCKADGRVSHDEIRAARQVMRRMELNQDQEKAAMALFNAGKQPDYPLDQVLQQLRAEIGHRLNLKRIFIEIQCMAAGADARVDPAERKILQHLCDVLGFSRQELDHLLRSVAGHHADGEASAVTSMAAAYHILGVQSSATDVEIKRAYRRLMNQHHPDKLVSKGLPEEMVKVATERTHQIRQAYEFIREGRGF